MNKIISKSIKNLMVFGTVALLSIPTMAAPAKEKIEAYLNPSVSYTFDGQTILKDAKTINYQNTNYISVAELSKALGKEVTFKDGVISITTPAEVAPLPEFIMIEQATVLSVDLESGQVTILPAGKENMYYNYVVLNTSPTETLVHDESNKAPYTIANLTPGMQVNVKHSPISTMSLPPQTFAMDITILKDQTAPILELTPSMPKEDTVAPESKGTPEVAPLEDGIIKQATVIEVDAKNNQVTILPAGQANTLENYIVLNTGDATSVHHEFNKRMYSVEDLEPGMQISVKHAPMMTASMPPQTPALEIIILQDQTAPVLALTPATPMEK